MYGGADDTREGAVLGVDALHFIVKPRAQENEQQGEFILKVNDLIYPYKASQLLTKDGVSYIQADKLLLGLGITQADVKVEGVSVGGEQYLPVRAVAEALGYKVFWDSVERAVLLEKEVAQTDSGMQKHYSEDQFKITN
ncbi:stalk domain-containing protein [Caldalkalibacillus mannanilyticus]|uniref:stalk domain-containing protein n=1 Tax=Caldalkalibacillus mannanilyticus TaxID=1418 RepID=UPI0034E1B82B